MQIRLQDIIGKVRNIDVKIIFLSFLGAFMADRIVNYFYDAPLFVLFALAALPLLWFQQTLTRPGRRWLLAFSVPFLIAGTLGNLIYGFHTKNISDLLFILLFVTFYQLNLPGHGKFSSRWVHVFTLTVLLLFSFTFINVNSVIPVLQNKKMDKYVGPPKKTASPAGTVSAGEKSKTAETLKKEEEKKTASERFLKNFANPQLDYLEYKRVYHHGLFRVPQVASYLFGFLGIFYLQYFWRRSRILALLIAGLFIFIVLYSGTRIFPLTVLVAIVIWFAMKPRRWPYLLAPVIFVGLLAIFRYEMIALTDGTFLMQYFSFFATAIDNLPRLSRIILWSSWLNEMGSFGVLDLLTGRTFHGSLLANLRNVYIQEWFHNDFFSILYSYGIICFSLYVIHYFKMFRDNRSLITGDFFVFVLYVSMPVMAFLNGFYYYFPMFTFYIFFLTVKSAKSNIAAHEDRDLRYAGYTE